MDCERLLNAGIAASEVWSRRAPFNRRPEGKFGSAGKLSEGTDNQYFITTHSNSIIDYANAAVYSVQLTEAGSNVRELLSAGDHFELVFDLGYRASDIAQSNCVIWVEGPSDRILLSGAISNADDSLIEGVHYSIMFYGGRLLRHLAVDDTEFKEFISLASINRRSAILIDSDKRKPSDELNATKKRVVKEFGERGLLCWVTEGREMENYISPVSFKLALSNVHPSYEAQALKRYSDYSSIKKGNQIAQADKIKMAHAVSDIDAVFLMEWPKRIADLVEFIKSSG